MGAYFDSPDRPHENACSGCGKFVANPAGGRCCEPASAALSAGVNMNDDIARAIFLAGLPTGDRGELIPGHTTWEDLGPKAKERYRRMAQAAKTELKSETERGVSGFITKGQQTMSGHEISHYAEVWPGSGMYVICECEREFRTTARHAAHQDECANIQLRKGGNDG